MKENIFQIQNPENRYKALYQNGFITRGAYHKFLRDLRAETETKSKGQVRGVRDAEAAYEMAAEKKQDEYDSWVERSNSSSLDNLIGEDTSVWLYR